VGGGGGGGGGRGGGGDLQRQGSAAETGLCASDNTAAFDGASPSSDGEHKPPCLK